MNNLHVWLLNNSTNTTPCCEMFEVVFNKYCSALGIDKVGIMDEARLTRVEEFLKNNPGSF